MGGALFVSVGQNLFLNKLLSGLAQYAPGLDPTIVLSSGATNIQSTTSSEYLAGVALAYNDALIQVFIAATAMAAASIIGSATIEWKSFKRKTLVEVGMA